MPARPRGSARGTSRRIPSTVRKLDKRGKGKTPPPPRILSRIRSNPPRRRSRSPPRPPKKIPMRRSPPLLKRRMSLSPKRNAPRKSREDLRLSPRRSRDLSKNRKPPPEKKFIEKPPYEGPAKDHQRRLYTKEDLKNMVFTVNRNYPGKITGKPINTNLVDPDNVVIVRRPGEGSTPIFNRPEIYENERQYNEYDPGPSHSDRLHYESSNSYDNFRVRDYYSDKEDRNLSNPRRSLRDYDYNPREERPREDSRYQPSTSMGRSRSFDRSREYLPERKERYDDRDIHRGPRKSLDRDRGRSDDRPMRRQHSPSPRRHLDQYRDYEDRRARSLERRDVEPSHFRDEYSSRDRFSNNDHSTKSRGHYDTDGRENPSPSRGRGGGFHQRARGGSVSGRPYGRMSGTVMRSMPPGRVFRGAPVARGPVRRLPFPPRKSFRGSLQDHR